MKTTYAFRFLILLGITSLFADMTYEGARSITGPYLAILGGSATIVGIVGGLGELIGYGVRIVFALYLELSHYIKCIEFRGKNKTLYERKTKILQRIELLNNTIIP
jgi:hypothetical protein